MSERDLDESPALPRPPAAQPYRPRRPPARIWDQPPELKVPHPEAEGALHGWDQPPGAPTLPVAVEQPDPATPEMRARAIAAAEAWRWTDGRQPPEQTEAMDVAPGMVAALFAVAGLVSGPLAIAAAVMGLGLALWSARDRFAPRSRVNRIVGLGVLAFGLVGIVLGLFLNESLR